MNFPSQLSDRGDDLLDVVLGEVGLPEEKQTIATNPSYLPVKLTDSPLSLSPKKFYDVTKKAVEDSIINEFRQRPILAAMIVNQNSKFLDGDADFRERVLDAVKETLGVKIPSGPIPICMHCRQIRDSADSDDKDQQNWKPIIGNSILNYFEIRFSHGLCPCCYEKHYSEFLPTVVPGTTPGSENKD